MLLSGLGFILVLIKYFRDHVLESSVNRYTILNDFVSKRDESDKKYILYWMKFFGEEFKNKTNENYLESIGCPVTNCIFTENKSLMNHHEFDAIIFHAAESWKLMDLPETRSPHQVYVMVAQE